MKVLKKISYSFSTLLLLSLLFLSKTNFAQEKLIVSAIPDQNPEQLNRLYNLLCLELSKSLQVPVEYKPLTNYPAAVTAFRTGSLDLVWFGGLTGVQARLQRPGATVLAQRDIDEKFHSVFIASKKSKITTINKLQDLKVLKGKRFTFGSESSTSGRLIPQHFLKKAGVELKDFKGNRPGFSGSHDATIALVQSGAYEAGVLNEQVWQKRLKEGKINTSKVQVIWRTPPYHDYHWLAQHNLDSRFGNGFTQKIKYSILSFNNGSKNQRAILELFGAQKFISSKKENYDKIEKIGREIGKIK